MKKIKLFSIAAAFVAAFAFTSCNTGDDNNSYYQPLTQAEKQTCYLKTSGSRMSKLAYVSDEHVTEKDGKKEYHDTLDVSTSIHGDGKDTVMTVNNFPVKIFAHYIPENVDTKDLKEALKIYEMPVSFKSVVYYYTVTPFIQFMLFPDAITVNLEYGGATHKVKFYCYYWYNGRYKRIIEKYNLEKNTYWKRHPFVTILLYVITNFVVFFIVVCIKKGYIF